MISPDHGTVLQACLRIIPHETQQVVLKDWTALYQKSGITFNQFLATLQQRTRQARFLYGRSLR